MKTYRVFEFLKHLDISARKQVFVHFYKMNNDNARFENVAKIINIVKCNYIHKKSLMK